MARKKKFAPNDNNLAIAYYRFSSHSQNDASIDQQREQHHAGRVRYEQDRADVLLLLLLLRRYCPKTLDK